MYGIKNSVKTFSRKIFDKNNFLIEEIVDDDLPSCIDAAGYVDPNVRIHQMIKAGIRIDEYNRAVYDYEHADVDDDGLSIDSCRYDDDNEMLRKAKTSLERYREEVYRQYYNSIKNKEIDERGQSSSVTEDKKTSSVKTDDV